MTKPYIDLSLFDGTEMSNIQTVLEKNRDVILLGVPGSGKTSLLNHFFTDHKKECELWKANEFASPLFSSVKESTKYLLIDGLDELRNASREKESVIYSIVAKLKVIENQCSILISCREIDWYGDNDDAALKKHLTSSFKRFYVSPLSEIQKEEFIDAYINDGEKKELFKKQILHQNYAKNLLNNPLTFRMMLELFETKPDEVPQNKMELYKKRVELSVEKAEQNLRNGVNILSTEDVFKYSSYIAFFYLISNIKSINNSVLEKISTEKDYSYDRLQEVCKLNIFERNDKDTTEDDFCFCHRTIAEYLCAYFLFFQKKNVENIPEDEIVAILTSKNGDKIPSELRGVYAWYCSMSESAQCFTIDPYSQYLYGDNSLFSLKNKKRVIKAIRNYANNKKPYFIRIVDEPEVNGFYDSELDVFLIGEYRKALKNRNNYLIFLEMVMTSVEVPSRKMFEFSKKVISIPDLENHFKYLFLPYLKDEVDFLKCILEKIKNGVMYDPENELLDNILFILYPNHITPQEIIEWISVYKETDCFYNHYQYLKKEVELEHKKKLIYSFYDKFTSGISLDHVLQRTFGGVVVDYLTTLLLNFKPDVFFKEQSCLSQKNYNLTYSFWTSNKKYLQCIGEEKKEELYNFYLSGITPQTEEDYGRSYQRQYLSDFCVLSLLPKNRIDILLQHIEFERQTVAKIDLLLRFNRELKSDEGTKDSADARSMEVAAKYGLAKELENAMMLHLSPDILKMQQEIAERERKRKEKITRAVKENVKKLGQMSHEQKGNEWKLLVKCARFYLFESESELETRLNINKENYQELLNILKEKISLDSRQRFYYEQTNIGYLAQCTLIMGGEMNDLYYCILCLNGCTEYEKIDEEDFLEYLYLISLHYGSALHSKRASFAKWFEKNDSSAINVLEKYISLFFSNDSEKASLKQFFREISSAEESSIYLKQLQRIFQDSFKDSNRRNIIIDRIFTVFNFKLTESFLTSLIDLPKSLSRKRNSLIHFIKKDSSLSKEDVETLIEILEFNFHTFSINEIYDTYKFVFVNALMNYFNTNESLEFHNGIQSNIDECAFYTNNVLLNQIVDVWGIELLQKLFKEHKRDLWGPRIKTRIDEINEILADNLQTKKSLCQAKKFALEKRDMKKSWFSSYISNPLYVLGTYFVLLIIFSIVFYLTKNENLEYLDCLRHSALSITTIGFDDASGNKNVIWMFGAFIEGVVNVILGILLSISIGVYIKHKV